MEKVRRTESESDGAPLLVFEEMGTGRNKLLLREDKPTGRMGTGRDHFTLVSTLTLFSILSLNFYFLFLLF